MSKSATARGEAVLSPHFRTSNSRTSKCPSPHAAYVDESPRMYRIFLDEDIKANTEGSRSQKKDRSLLMQSRAAYLFYATPNMPRLAFPRDAVCFAGSPNKSGIRERTDEVPATGLVESDVPFELNSMGDRYLDLVRPDGSKIEQVAWTLKRDTVIEGPFSQTLSPNDLVILETSKFPSVWEEDQPLLGHVKDPYHRVDAVRTNRRIRILISTRDGDEIVVADTARIDQASDEHAVAVFETAFPTRYYLPPSALVVNANHEEIVMEPPPACPVEAYPKSTLSFVCPYKGVSRYHVLTLPDGEKLPQTVWAYPEPIPALNLAGLVCFNAPHEDRVKLVVDDQSMQL